MSSPTSDPLFSAIDALLSGARADAASAGARTYWQQRPRITSGEIGMLRGLVCHPRCVEAIAGMLDRDLPATQQLLDALAAIGLVEARGTQYAATTATALYFHALEGGTIPSTDGT